MFETGERTIDRESDRAGTRVQFLKQFARLIVYSILQHMVVWQDCCVKIDRLCGVAVHLHLCRCFERSILRLLIRKKKELLLGD